MCRREVHIFSYKRVITCLKAHNHAGSISFCRITKLTCKKSSQTSKALQQHLNYCAAEIQAGKIPRTQTAHMLILLIAMIRNSADASKDENADDKDGVDTVGVLQQLVEVVVRHTGDEALSGSPSSRQASLHPPT